MGFNVYLDDVRPAPENWILVKTVPELVQLILIIGDQINCISLDHDLGLDTPSGYTFVTWLEKKVFKGEYKEIPKLKVHSRNPIGRKKMESGIRAIWRRLDETKI